MFKSMKKVMLSEALGLVTVLGACSGGSNTDEVVIYSNGDEEAVVAMENALNGAGYEGDSICSNH